MEMILIMEAKKINKFQVHNIYHNDKNHGLFRKQDFLTDDNYHGIHSMI